MTKPMNKPSEKTNYNFLMNFMAHPVAKASVPLVVTAALITLGAVFTTLMSLTMASVLTGVGLFSAALVYRRAQSEKDQNEKPGYYAGYADSYGY